MAGLMFDPGQFTARLDLEAPLETGDGQGGVTTAWQVVATLWARIEPTGMDASELGGQDRAIVTHRIWIRYRDGVVPAMRFRKGSRSFTLSALRDPDETRRWLLCLCEEGTL
jgi:SPP1 family predicted phage head-tail adaptor